MKYNILYFYYIIVFTIGYAVQHVSDLGMVSIQQVYGSSKCKMAAGNIALGHIITIWAQTFMIAQITHFKTRI